MNPQELTAYLNSFPNLNKTERELLYVKIMSVYHWGQIDGAKELRELYHKARQEKPMVKEVIEKAYYPEGLE